MSAATKIEIIDVPNRLSERAARPGGMTPDEMVRAGLAAIAKHAARYQDVRRKDLDELRALFARFSYAAKGGARFALASGKAASLRDAEEGAQGAPAAHVELLDGIRRKADDLRSHATTFGYPIVTAVANSLSTLAERLGAAAAGSALALEALETHVRALTLLIEKNVTGDGGELGGELIAGLKGVVDKVATEFDDSGLVMAEQSTGSNRA
jgi:hypothetical protein